jgi:GWxTD domain-containing protein
LEFALSSNRSQRAERGPSGPLFFALTFLLLSTVSAFAADPLLDWIKSPEAYLATNEELDQWKREVVTPDDAQKFIDEFWRKRGEGLKKEIRTRIEFADKQFALGKVPGSRTQMGRVWMLLGTPSEVKTERGNIEGGAAQGGPGTVGVPRMQDNSVERGARVQNRWLYRKDRLRPELGLSELTIVFQSDVARGSQTIENPGLVEPYLRKAAAFLSTQAAALAATTPSTQIAKPAAPGADPLWSVTPNLNGAIFTGEAFLSPREAPFYAVNLFVPSEATAFKDWKTGLLVTLIRDAAGNQVVSERQQVDLTSYDAAGNRFVDRSYALAPGKYDSVIALYSPDGGTLLASHREQFEVAAPTAPRASKLFLSSKVDMLETQDALDPFTFVAQKYAVRGDRKFRPSDKLSFFTIIANPEGETPNLMQKMTFTRDGKSFVKTPLEPAQVVQTGPNTYLVGVTFDPDTFKPGHYTLELQVRDFNAPEGSEMRSKGYVLNTEFDVLQ